MKDTEIKNFFYRLQNEKSDNNDETSDKLLQKPTPIYYTTKV